MDAPPLPSKLMMLYKCRLFTSKCPRPWCPVFRGTGWNRAVRDYTIYSKMLQQNVPCADCHCIGQLLTSIFRELNSRKQWWSLGNRGLAVIISMHRYLCSWQPGRKAAVAHPCSFHWWAGRMPAAWTRLFLGSGSRWNPQSHDPYLAGSWSHQTRTRHQTELWHHLQIQARSVSITGNVLKTSEGKKPNSKLFFPESPFEEN